MSKISRGFTLVELMIYMALMGAFIVVLTETLLSVLDDQAESQATSSVEQDGRYILSRMLYDFRRADSLVAPSVYGQASSSAQIMIDGQTYTYSLASGNLNLNGENLNSYGASVSGVSFTLVGNPGGKKTLKIAWQLTSTTKRQSGTENRSYQTTIEQR